MNTFRVDLRNQTNGIQRRVYVPPSNYKRPDWIGK